MTEKRKNCIKGFIKDWMLIISMITGAGLYLLYMKSPVLHPAGPILELICKKLQPLLLFTMLFLSFSKIEPSQLKPHKWHIWLLAFQGGIFTIISLVLIWALHDDSSIASFILSHRLALESALVCFICPTATACAVVTGKLGGNMAGVITYTVIINMVVAFLIPLFIPLIYPSQDMNFSIAFAKILSKVFPLLIMPCMLAWLVRYLFPKLHSQIIKYTDLSFNIWAFALTLAILMSTRAIVKNDGSLWLLTGIAAGSLVSCIIQFYVGRRIGEKYGCRISSGQALGQKNTVFAIWVGYTFMDPIVSVAGGFYSIWHNVYNSIQLKKRRRELDAENLKIHKHSEIRLREE